MTQYELEMLWVKSALPGSTFPFDTRVRAVAGEHIGRHGRVVALLEMEPTPLYVVEEPEGTSFNAQQSELESVDSPERPRAQLHLSRSEEETSGE
jgi:hypothetical protein